MAQREGQRPLRRRRTQRGQGRSLAGLLAAAAAAALGAAGVRGFAAAGAPAGLRGAPQRRAEGCQAHQASASSAACRRGPAQEARLPLASAARPARQHWYGSRAGLVASALLSRAVSAATRRSGTSASPGVGPEDCPPPVLYDQRWVQLGFLAALALLSDLVCFSVASTPQTWDLVFHQSASNLIDLFLFTNVFSCLAEPWIIRKFGLRAPIVGAGALMAVGCLLRSGLPFTGDLPDYVTVVGGTILVAIAQPFFQCTPPLLSATWFAPDERAMATAVAINFNQVGIASAFLLGGAFAGGGADGLKEYFGYITVAAFVVAGAAFFLFQERPPTPPSASALEALEAAAARSATGEEEEEVSFPEQAWKFLQTPGFVPPLSAFVISIAVTNVVGAFMEQKLSRAGIEDQQVIDYAGAGFELAIVIGGIVLGGLVDKNKEYKAVTLACLIATLVATIVFGYGHAPVALCILALLAVGAFAGPVQPINAELAVEVTYPSDENAIEAIQQLCGNLFSALLLPICEFAALYEFPVPGVPGLQREHLPGEKWESGADSIQGDTLVLFFLILSVTLYFSTFSGRLRRTEVDENKCIIEEGEEESPKPLGGSPSVTLVDRAGSPVSVIIGAEEVDAKK